MRQRRPHSGQANVMLLAAIATALFLAGGLFARPPQREPATTDRLSAPQASEAAPRAVVIARPLPPAPAVRASTPVVRPT
ncbi:MAG TPA: hypothetical protein VNT60_07740, partial [Deinococcales bacterium]|nr:hypothetical protein [Deinococcales bacterium]